MNGHRAENPEENVQEQLVLSTGPFKDLELPHASAKANAAYFVRNLITTYLITHPHLDHISGFVINTAGFQHTSRPKRLAGLPFTIDAFKNHIFNDILWPNLSDEDGGVGLVSYMRLAEGGNLAIGSGEGRGYIEVCDGLAVKSWSVSHGKCMHTHAKRGSGSGNSQEAFNESISRRPSQNVMTPTGIPSHVHPGFCVTDSSAFFLRDEHTGSEILVFGDVEPDSLSLGPRTVQVWSDAAPKIASGILKAILIECSYDESQSDETLFGHLAPRHVIEEMQALAEKVRTHKMGEERAEREPDSVAAAAAVTSPFKRKRASTGSSIQMLQEEEGEDVFSEKRASPRREVLRRTSYRRKSSSRSRKGRVSNISPASRPIGGDEEDDTHEYLDSAHSPLTRATASRQDSASYHQLPTPGTTATEDSSSPSLHTAGPGTGTDTDQTSPLEGLRVIIIHVKDNLTDGPEAGDIILAQLAEIEKAKSGLSGRLGCSFAISKPGESIWL